MQLWTMQLHWQVSVWLLYDVVFCCSGVPVCWCGMNDGEGPPFRSGWCGGTAELGQSSLTLYLHTIPLVLIVEV